MNKPIISNLPPEIVAYIASLEQQVNTLKADLQSKEDHIRQITDLLAKSKAAMFGQSSEKGRYQQPHNSQQLSLFNEAEVEADVSVEEPETITVPEHQRKTKRTKETLAETLPVVKVLCELSEEEQHCPICNSPMKVLGQELVRRELEIIPEKLRIVEYYRHNYVCPVCEKETDEALIVKAPVPKPVIRGGLASPSAVAYIMYQKYVNGMPLYRQEKDWCNKGVEISRATLANWMIGAACQWLEPIYKRLHELLLQQEVIHADETTVQVLNEPGKTPSSESRMWVYCAGHSCLPIILFEYQPSRGGYHAQAFLEGFTGYLISDGYAGYNKVTGVTHCGCWSHVRRKYVEAMKGKSKGGKALTGREYCDKLFALEKAYDKEGLEGQERYAARQERSKPVLEAYWSWVKTVNALAGSSLGTAITYSQNQREALEGFLLDGRLELSNNRAENAIRPFVIGRKNWLFSNSVQGARASAMIYSIVETAKANGLNVFMYLYHLLKELPNRYDKKAGLGEIDDLLPMADDLPQWCRL